MASRLSSCAIAALSVATLIGQTPPTRGLSEAAALRDAYDAILDADFDRAASRIRPACGSVPVFCPIVEAVSLWWHIALDPADVSYDARFLGAAERAIAAADDWTSREPLRAEAWFARGAAYGARAQWRVLRRERLAAARDGKRIKDALERALTLDPTLHDAKFGLGLYHYYADIGPAALRWLRWMLLLPGGDRRMGLREIIEARDEGAIVYGEATYQLHLIYLWYEHRAHDALSLIKVLQQRYPRNPLFYLIEADIHDTYFHDLRSSEITLRALIDRAETKRVHVPAIALRRAQRALIALNTRAKR